MEHFYEIEEGLFRPTPLTVSPWNPRHQSGVVIGGLLAYLVEQAPSLEPMLLTRLTIDIVRAVPMAPILGRWKVVRDGRKIQHIEATLEVDDQVVARALAVRVRLAETPAYHSPGPAILSVEEAADLPPLTRRRGAIETRAIQGGPTKRGPGKLWARPSVEMFPGVPASYLAGAAMIADVGSGASTILDSREWSFANVSIALHMHRAPVSAWIYVDAVTRTAGNGIGLVETRMADQLGPFCRARQNLFIDAVPPDAPFLAPANGQGAAA